METADQANRLRVQLGKPIPKLNAHRCIHIGQGSKEKAMTISFRRTVRLPDDGNTYNLPPDLGCFPLYNISHHTAALPETMRLKGGIFMPVHNREALWIRFESIRPFAVKALVGGINAISGEPIMPTLATMLRRSRLLSEKKNIQDYIVVDSENNGQKWLDGIARVNGKVQQFVAVPSGTGYSVESQVTGKDDVGGMQIIVTPIKSVETGTISVQTLTGRLCYFRVKFNHTVRYLSKQVTERTGAPDHQMRLIYDGRLLEFNRSLSYYNIKNGSKIVLILCLIGGGHSQSHNLDAGEMGVGAGGSIEQSILADPHPAKVWDRNHTTMFNVQLLHTALFQKVTGHAPEPTPITAKDYADAGLPFFKLPEKEDSGIYGAFDDILTIEQEDNPVGRSVNSGLKKELKFPVIQLDDNGMAGSFMPVEDMIAEVERSAWMKAH